MTNPHEKPLMPFQMLDVYGVAKAMAVAVHRAAIRDSELRDQAGRASKSAFLQLSEGLPNDSPAMRRKYFTCARNSVCEVTAALDLATDLGFVDAQAASEIAELAVRLAKMLRRLA